MTLSQAEQSLLTDLILPLALGLVSWAVTALYQRQKARDPQSVYTLVLQYAEDAVAKAEQLSTRTTDPISPDVRKRTAVADIEAILAAHHLSVPSQLIDMAVESAVYRLGNTGVSGGAAPIPAELQPVPSIPAV